MSRRLVNTSSVQPAVLNSLSLSCHLMQECGGGGKAMLAASIIKKYRNGNICQCFILILTMSIKNPNFSSFFRVIDDKQTSPPRHPPFLDERAISYFLGITKKVRLCVCE